jgi:ABC-2 type transport system permease protein
MTESAQATYVPSLPVVFSLAHREILRFFRQRTRVFGALGQPIIFWLLFSEGFKRQQLDYAFFFPGTLAMIVLFSAIFATISIIEDRNEGFLQGVLVAPVTRWSMVLGKVLGGSAIAWMQAMLFLVLGWATLESVAPTIAEVALAALLLAIISVALTALGFVMAWRNDSTHGYHALMSMLLFPMWLLAIFPVEPGSIVGYLVRLNPLAYGVVGLRHLLEQNVPANLAFVGPAIAWGVTVAFAALMVAAAVGVSGTRTKGDFR